MSTEPTTTEQLRKELAESLVKYGMTVEEFLQTDIDDLPDSNLRDTKLMLRGVFEVLNLNEKCDKSETKMVSCYHCGREFQTGVNNIRAYNYCPSC